MKMNKSKAATAQKICKNKTKNLKSIKLENLFNHKVQDQMN